MSFPELEEAQRKKPKQVPTATYPELEQARAKAIEEKEAKYQKRRKAAPTRYTAFVQRVSAYARQEVKSAKFYRGIGFPEFAGKYEPFEVPEGFKVEKLEKTPKGLEVSFAPIHEQPKGIAQTLLEWKPPTLLEITGLGGLKKAQTLTAITEKPSGSTLLARFIAPFEASFYGVGSLVGGAKKTLETGQPQLAYGWEWAGLKTPVIPSTISGALVSSGIETVMTGKPVASEELKDVMAWSPDELLAGFTGELVLTLLIGKGIEKAGVAVKKVGSWVYEKSGIKYSHTLYKMKESWRTFSVKHIPELTIKRSHTLYRMKEAWRSFGSKYYPDYPEWVEYGILKPLKPYQQMIPSFRGSRFESWLIQHSGIYRKHALLSLTYGEVAIPTAEKFVESTYQAIPKGLPYTHAAWEFTLFPRTGGVMLSKIAAQQMLKPTLPLFFGIGTKLIPFSEVQAKEEMLSFKGGKPARTFKYEQIEHLGSFSKVQWTTGFEGKYGFVKPRMPTLKEFMLQQKLLPFTTQTQLTRAGIFPYIPKIGYFTGSTKKFLSHILAYGLVSGMNIPRGITGKKLKYETEIPPLTLPKPITYPEAKPKRKTKPFMFTFPSVAPKMRMREKLVPWSLPGFKAALKQPVIQKQISIPKLPTSQISRTGIPTLTPTIPKIPSFPFEERRKKRRRKRKGKRIQIGIGRYKRFYPSKTPKELVELLI